MSFGVIGNKYLMRQLLLIFGYVKLQRKDAL